MGVNYINLNVLWEECLETNLQPDVKGRIIGVQTQMQQLSLLFGLKLCERILNITDNLSKTLQKKSLSAAEAQHVTKLTVTTLKKMRTENDFNLFFKLVLTVQESTATNPPTLPRKRKAPERLRLELVKAIIVQQWRNTISSTTMKLLIVLFVLLRVALTSLVITCIVIWKAY